jgi:glycosyltransferase involved in cell wall biosynthesis
VVGNEGLDSYFSFTGWVFEVDNFLEKADLYIHTAINDNCPYAVIEAISNKLPAIGFRVGGLPEIIDEEFLFHLNDYRSVADFIIKNHLSLCSIGDLQYEKICDSFSVTNQFNRTKEEYLSLLKQPVLVAVEKDRRVVVE